jgi:PhnB protein
MVEPVPDGFLSVHLGVCDAATLLDFVKKTFGAKEKMRMSGPEGRIAHVGVTIGDS